MPAAVVQLLLSQFTGGDVTNSSSLSGLVELLSVTERACRTLSVVSAQSE